MSNTTSSSRSGGIGFAGPLTIVFITLKLTGVIGWSWWWVLAPLWIGFALGVIFLIGFFLVVVAIEGTESRSRNRKTLKILKARKASGITNGRGTWGR